MLPLLMLRIKPINAIEAPLDVSLGENSYITLCCVSGSARYNVSCAFASRSHCAMNASKSAVFETTGIPDGADSGYDCSGDELATLLRKPMKGMDAPLEISLGANWSITLCWISTSNFRRLSAAIESNPHRAMNSVITGSSEGSAEYSLVLARAIIEFIKPMKAAFAPLDTSLGAKPSIIVCWRFESNRNRASCAVLSKLH
mmetsp:Transcript_23109/g.36930  ORF Transcript_23109/g.36930 Transcript_23109/m.36930 type:complete len:201 (+) Transcript_23109:36-638(+)